MNVIIIGLGNQGRKRLAAAGRDVVAMVDPVAPDATARAIQDVPLPRFDAALVCTPDNVKVELLTYLLSHGKHVLVEKPLLIDADQAQRLKQLAQSSGAACYTAYNHRFEPHVMTLRRLLDQRIVGDVYLARGFYGNGTACDVKESLWRDHGLGVLSDLGSHLLDLALFWFGDAVGPFELWQGSRFENQAWDHVLFGAKGKPTLILEGSLLSWKNTFTVDVIGALGSAHIRGLCKWGPSTLTIRTRVLPSGRPQERIERIEQPDSTWRAEYAHFQQLCRTGVTTLDHDRWIATTLMEMARMTESVSTSTAAYR